MSYEKDVAQLKKILYLVLSCWQALNFLWPNIDTDVVEKTRRTFLHWLIQEWNIYDVSTVYPWLPMAGLEGSLCLKIGCWKMIQSDSNRKQLPRDVLEKRCSRNFPKIHGQKPVPFFS